MAADRRSFWERLKGEAKNAASGSPTTNWTTPLRPPSPKPASRITRGRHCNTRQVSASEGTYVPLPAAPNSWEEWQSKNPNLAKYDELFRRASSHKLQDVIARYRAIPVEDRRSEVAKRMLSPYRQLRDRAFKNRRFSEAMQWATSMMEDVPAGITNTDRRKYNRIIDGLNEQKKKHSFEKLELEPEEKPNLYAVSGSGWDISEVIKLSDDEKPDKGFKELTITRDGFLYYAPRGGTGRFPDARSVVKTVGFQGEVMSELELPHDIYRIYTSPVAGGFTVLSSDCNLYSYDSLGNLLYSENLNPVCDSKNFIRCVAHTGLLERLLFTAVDEAWCIDRAGHDLWAIETPPKAGWEKTYQRIEHRGDEQEVATALSVLGLSFPVSPDQIKERYREMALQWHPDRNPDPRAHEIMVSITNAYEALTGMNAQAVLGPARVERVYRKVISKQEVVPGISLTIEMGGPGEDWIYAAGFSADSKSSYLGAYSGRVLKVDEGGRVLHVFDVGNTPRKIVDTGERLYIQTDTRLYVLMGEQLVFIKDTYDVGHVVIGGTGFWYLSSKELQLFDCNGRKAGQVITKDPIRAFYFADSKLIVETRQHRATIDWRGD